MSDEFKHISKLIVTLTDKMRRQDEGIKIHKEISISIKDFNRVIDIQAKAIEEGQLDIIKEAELLADKSDNGTRPNKSPEKV